jgi:capsular exopolysaccharide synthesis family protein
MSDRLDSGERGSRRAASEEAIEVRRYVDALRRSLPLIIGIVVILAASAYAVSSSLPKRYKATASIVQRSSALSDAASNTDSLVRDLNTIDALLTTDSVLSGAARAVRGETTETLRDKVSSNVDPSANLIYVTAKDRAPRTAAAIANAVATTFVAEQAEIERRQYTRGIADLQEELARVAGQSDAEQAVRERIAQLRVQVATAGSDLQIAQRAVPPAKQDTPRPLRNTALAIVLGIFLGVLVAIGRDQLVPRIGSARELSRLLELPVLVTIPHVRRRAGRRTSVLSGIEYEAYQTLATSIRFALTPADGPHVILVTSALHAEGKSTVTTRLGRALAHAGQPTLLVSADLRWPTLHELTDVELGPGLADLLSAVESRAATLDMGSELSQRIIPAAGQRRGTLDVLPSGRKPDDPGELLSTSSLDAVFEAIADLDYPYVLIDAPPLLGIADTQSLARQASAILYVARLDRITLDNVVDAQDVLDRLGRPQVGMVVIGARAEVSPYYVSSRMPALDDA